VPVAVRSRLVVDPAEAVLDACLAAAGIIRLFSYHIADAVREGGLTIWPQGFEPPPLPVNIVDQPAKVRVFVDFTAPQCKTQPACDLAPQSP
jgi:DNA-binding transcriptional LysR family regulator